MHDFAKTFLLVASLLGVCFTSCAPADQDQAVGPGSDARPQRGGTAQIGVRGEPKSFIDWSGGTNIDVLVRDLVFRRLARPGSEPGTFEPDLARSWEIDSANRSIVFKLRDDVTWEDGRSVTASDVLFTHNRAAAPGSELANYKRHIESVESPSPDQVVFRFRREYPEMLAHAVKGHIYPEHVLGPIPADDLPTHEFNRTPLGNGPFRLAAWDSGRFLEFRVRENLGDEDRPRLERIVLRTISDPGAALRELEAGNLDLLRVDLEVGQRLESEGRIKVQRVATAGYFHLVWNARRDPWSRPGVRRALASLIDRRALARRFAGIEDAACDSPVPPDHPWHEPLPELGEPVPSLAPEGFTRDAAGQWRDARGDALRIELLGLTSSAHHNVASTVAQTLRDGGIEVDLVQPDTPSYIARMRSGDFDLILRARHKASEVDLADAFASSGASNYGGFKDAELDQLLASAESDETTKAQAAFRAAQHRIAMLEPWTFLFFRSEDWAVQPRLRGIELNPQRPWVVADRWWVADGSLK